MRNLIILLVAIMGIQKVHAQSEVEVIRFSQQQISGSTRAMSLGGAVSSIGGEASSLNFNPAGLGMFTRDELTFTPSISVRGNSSIHYGNEVYNSKPKFGIENISYVKVNSITGKPLKNLNYGISHTKNLFFDEIIEIEGTNPESSMVDAFYNLLQLNGSFNPNNPPQNYPFSADLAWQTFLLDTFQNQYLKAINSYNNLQYKKVIREGNSSNVLLSASGNINYKWYFGGSVGIQSVNFVESSEYSETTNQSDTSHIIDGFVFEEFLTTQGTGINIKIGGLYRINDRFRVSLAVHSPTFMSLVDNWESYMATNFKNFGELNFRSPEGSFRYRLFTPAKAIVGATIMFGKMGFVTLDYEHIDYSMARYSTRQNIYDYAIENEGIKNRLRSTGNIRLGTEWRYGKMAYRMGYGIYSNPYQPAFTANMGYQTFSMGLGFRLESFFIDAGFQTINFNKTNYILYTPELAPIELTELSGRNLRMNITLGFKY